LLRFYGPPANMASHGRLPLVANSCRRYGDGCGDGPVPAVLLGRKREPDFATRSGRLLRFCGPPADMACHGRLPWVACFCQKEGIGRGVGTVPAVGRGWREEPGLAARGGRFFCFYGPLADMEGRGRQPWVGNFCQRAGDGLGDDTVHALQLGRSQQADFAAGCGR
jgi:hypothetical protein